MKTVFLGLTLISSLAFTETAKFTVEGMHCGGCKAMITDKVCTEAAMKSNYESCEVKLTDAKKQMGEVTIVTKKDVKVDVAVVKAGVKAAGEDYKVTKEEIK